MSWIHRCRRRSCRMIQGLRPAIVLYRCSFEFASFYFECAFCFACLPLGFTTASFCLLVTSRHYLRQIAAALTLRSPFIGFERFLTAARDRSWSWDFHFQWFAYHDLTASAAVALFADFRTWNSASMTVLLLCEVIASGMTFSIDSLTKASVNSEATLMQVNSVAFVCQTDREEANWDWN